MSHVIVSDTIPIRHDYAPNSDAEKVLSLAVIFELSVGLFCISLLMYTYFSFDVHIFLFFSFDVHIFLF